MVGPAREVIHAAGVPLGVAHEVRQRGSGAHAGSRDLGLERPVTTGAAAGEVGQLAQGERIVVGDRGRAVGLGARGGAAAGAGAPDVAPALARLVGRHGDDLVRAGRRADGHGVVGLLAAEQRRGGARRGLGLPAADHVAAHAVPGVVGAGAGGLAVLGHELDGPGALGRVGAPVVGDLDIDLVVVVVGAPAQLVAAVAHQDAALGGVVAGVGAAGGPDVAVALAAGRVGLAARRGNLNLALVAARSPDVEEDVVVRARGVGGEAWWQPVAGPVKEAGQNNIYIRPPIHPRWQRCSSVT